MGTPSERDGEEDGEEEMVILWADEREEEFVGDDSDIPWQDVNGKGAALDVGEGADICTEEAFVTGIAHGTEGNIGQLHFATDACARQHIEANGVWWRPVLLVGDVAQLEVEQGVGISLAGKGLEDGGIVVELDGCGT